MRSAEARPIAVLVDAYTTGNHLPPAFDRLGVDVVHVQSTPELMTSMTLPDLTAYKAVIPYGTPEETAARLAEFRPICVVPGQEPGVPSRTSSPSGSDCRPTAPRSRLPAVTSTR